LLEGFTILALSFLIGIVISFYKWDRGSPFDLSNWGSFSPLGRATYGPIVFAFVLFPITLPLALVLIGIIYVGIKKERFWPLSMLGFLSTGLLWLWYITVLCDFD
jgi:hypothetical protein